MGDGGKLGARAAPGVLGNADPGDRLLGEQGQAGAEDLAVALVREAIEVVGGMGNEALDQDRVDQCHQTQPHHPQHQGRYEIKSSESRDTQPVPKATVVADLSTQRASLPDLKRTNSARSPILAGRCGASRRTRAGSVSAGETVVHATEDAKNLRAAGSS